MQKTQLDNKTGLVTGSGSGIGRACALLLAEKGANVMVSDINTSAAESTAQEIMARGGKALAYPCDVCNPEEVAAMVAATVTHFGQLDFAVNNAGVLGAQVPLHKYTVEQWQQVIGVNLGGVFFCMQEELKVFYPQGHGIIVNIASTAALKGSAADTVYTASKHGVGGLTKAAAVEAAKAGIRINAVCPGGIETPMVREYLDSHPDGDPNASSPMPIGRWGKPEEIAEAVAWLCSDAASLMTGHMMAVDGGWAVN